MKYLLDTNVVSHLRTPEKSRDLAAWLNDKSGDDLYLSVIAVGEIRKGIETVRPSDPAFATDIETWLGALERDYGDRIAPIDNRVAQAWGRMLATDPRYAIDTLLAATAFVHEMAVVTRNTKHFQARGVPVIDPFEPGH